MLLCAFVCLCWCLLRAGYAVGAALLWRLSRAWWACLRDVWRACVDERCFACGRVVVVLLPPCGARWRGCRLVAFLRHRGCCITLFISGFVVFLTPVRRCLFLAVLRGFLAF